MIAFSPTNPAIVRVPDSPLPAPDSAAPDRSSRRPGRCLHEMFERQAKARPDAEALVVGTARVTYRQLNRRANRIAHHLRSLGVGRETLVGVLMDRTADLVPALLGVLKAGGAYVPLDPTYPPERLAFMVQDARVHTILLQSALRPVLASLGFGPGLAPGLVCVDTAAGIEAASTENPSSLARADSLAYIIYTSGSTGQPKGVALEHRNAAALIAWAGEVYSEQELSGVLAGVSISFDPSILDLFVPLCLGGKVILAPHTLSLPDLPAADEVRLISTVPSVMREMLHRGDIPTSVETVNLGGEPLSPQLVAELYALPHIRRVYDLYGPTETTTCSTFAWRSAGGPAIIGRPITGTRVHLLDEHFLPVPPGTAGELFISGCGVARGYLNRPAATAEKFLPLPGSADPAARLYRTGDVCRERPDGNLEFVGRLDQQVKIRGFRVELGEIESVLRTHPAVDETIVLAHEEESGQRRLVAYVVPRVTPTTPAGEGPEAAAARLVPQLRAHLADRIPDYMQPGAYVLLDRFERTSSGKVCRATLPAPVRTRAGAGEFAAARTATETLICQVWQDLLELEQVGVHDDFFQLGGDSLLGVAVLVEIEKRTGRKLPIEAMLEAPSVRRLAALLDAGREPAAAASGPAWVVIQPQGTRPRLFLVHGVGGGMLWGYANLARHLGPDQPVFAFRAGEPGVAGASDTIEKMAAQYVQELRRLQPDGPYALGGYCFGGNVAYAMARLLEASGQRVSLLALMNASPPNSTYDLRSWSPLYCFKFLRNLGHWVNGFRQWGAAKQRRFLGWKLATLRQRLVRGLRLTAFDPVGPVVGELVDLSAVPDDQRSRWEMHVRALNRHHTQPYGGKVVLLRTPGHPLNCSYDARCGWGELARGGVEVRVIPGLHDSLLEEPYVQVLARELKVHLDAIAPVGTQLP